MQLDQRKPETSREALGQVMVGWRNGKDELVEIRNPRIVKGLILVAQFKSFLMPLLILLAIPPGIAGVLVVLATTDTTLNIMSLMGIVMLAGIAVSNSILIVEFTQQLLEGGMPLREAAQTACRVRLRPILMTSLATVFGLIPMALKLGTGRAAYAPLGREGAGGSRGTDCQRGEYRLGECECPSKEN